MGKGGQVSCVLPGSLAASICSREHEEMPKNVVEATSGLKSFNLIPAVGE